MGLGSFVGALTSIVSSMPKNIGSNWKNTFKNPVKAHFSKEGFGKSLIGGLRGPGRLITSDLTEGIIKSVDDYSEGRAAAKKKAAMETALGERANFEALMTEQEKTAKRKAAEEQLARRKATPGRPIFTSLNNANRGSLLQ